MRNSHFQEKRLPYTPLPLSGEQSFSVGDVLKYRAFFKAHPPSLVVSHASLSARIAAKSLSIPAISVRHCDTPISTGSLRLYHAVTDATVATSLPLARHLREAGVKNVFVIENGYTPIGVPSQTEKRAARERLALPCDRIVIGLAGRLAPVKGHATAIQALSLLPNEKHRFLLCFLGEGEEEPRLREQMHALSLENEVCFLGFSSDVRPFYHALDAHISCSLDSETSSLSLAEGMSAGCVTFASDIDGNRVRVGDGGSFFPCGDAAALASLFRLLLDRKKRAQLSASAIRRSVHLPTWQAVGRQYTALFDIFRSEVGAKGCFFPKDMLQ